MTYKSGYINSSTLSDSDKTKLISELEKRIKDLEGQLRKSKNAGKIFQSDEIHFKRAEIAGRTGKWKLYLDTGIITGSEGAMKLYGFDKTSMNFEDVKQLPLPEYRPILEKALKDLIASGRPNNIEFKIKKADTGEIVDMLSISEYDSDNRIIYGFIQDITDRKKAEEEILKNNFDLSELLKISLGLQETVERKQTLSMLVEKAVHIIGLDTGSIYLLNEDKLYLEVASPGLPDDFPEEFRKALIKNHPHIHHALSTNSPLVIHDINNEQLSKEEKVIIGLRNMQSLLYIPLFAQKKVIGVMILATINRKFDFRKREVDLCRTLSSIASLALENSILFEQLNANVTELKSVIAEKNIANIELNKSEQKYRHLFENVQDVFFQIDNNGIIMDVSPSIKPLTGYESDELINRHISLLYYDIDERKNILQQFADNKEISDHELRMRDKKGNFRTVSVNGRQVFNPDGTPDHVDGSIRDISERKRAEERLNLLNRAVEQSPVSIIITDPKGIIEYVNPMFTILTGYTIEEISGKTPSILNSGYQSPEFYKELWNTILSGKNWSGEIRNKNKKGEYYWESVVISPMLDEKGKINHFIGVKENITDKKQMLENLIFAKEKAEESDRLKTAFLHNISHEIRTPLNAIIGFSGFLERSDLQPEKKKEYIDIIFHSNNQLLSIIDDILNISHIEAGQVSLRESKTDILRLLRNIQGKFLVLASKKNLDFRVNINLDETESVIITDETKLRQVITNLLDNSIKFTHEGFVEMGCVKKDDMLEFFVRDSGIGIAEGEHKKIFDRFYQVDKTLSRVYSGTGLGLSISESYVTLLGGKFKVKSILGKGSLFSFSIPYKKPED